jgi:hypothetical protein
MVLKRGSIQKSRAGAWWHMPTIQAFGRLRQEDRKFEANLHYTARHCFIKIKLLLNVIAVVVMFSEGWE